MFNLTGKQWLIVIAVVLGGVALQVAWVLLRPTPEPRNVSPAPTAPPTPGR